MEAYRQRRKGLNPGSYLPALPALVAMVAMVEGDPAQCAPKASRQHNADYKSA